MYLTEGWINDNGWVKLEHFMTKAMLYCQIIVTVIVQGTAKSVIFILSPSRFGL